MKVAYKLLSRDEATFEELTPREQKLWTSFETDQIYRLLTDKVPEFRFNWYTITTADGYSSDQPQPVKAKAPTVKPSTAPPALPPAPPTTVKAPKASTTARAALPSSSTSSAYSSKPSTTPLSPTASTSGAIPKTKTTTTTPSSSTTPSWSPTPPPILPVTRKSA